MIVTIANEILKVSIDSHGAEIKSIVKAEREYMWSGDPRYWEDTAPVLFPMVSSLLDDKYTYNGKTYSFGQHGFASESEFSVVETKEDSVVLRLEQTDYTKSVYPFDYDFTVTFCLKGNRLDVNFKVANTSDTQTMYFNTGAHEGYALFDDGDIDDYRIEFEKKEKLLRMVLDRPVFDGKTCDLGESDVLDLDDSYFEIDGIFFLDIKSDYVTLRRKDGTGSIRVYFNCDNLGFWKMPGGKYLCIEPWDGFCPYEGDGYELKEKRFVKTLQPGEEYDFYHGIEIN